MALTRTALLLFELGGVAACVSLAERKPTADVDVRAEAAQAPAAGQTWLGLLHLARTKPAVPPRRPSF